MSDAVIIAFVAKWVTSISFWIWAHKIVTGIVAAGVLLCAWSNIFSNEPRRCRLRIDRSNSSG